FGLLDPYVGIMHGVVLKIAPEARVVDICHGVASHDVFGGAWTIAQAYRFFPQRTVHVIVVDPGVGSLRRPIIAETDDYIFVAPDNGVLSLVEAGEPRFAVRHVTADRYFLEPVSQTFHGRDIFAPVAAWLSRGIAPSEFGPAISDYVRLAMPQVEHIAENRLRGAVLRVDRFGNLITNIGELDAPALFGGEAPAVTILIAGQNITRLCRSYAEGAEGELFAIVGSSGYLEIAARQASAAEKLVAGVGTPVGVVVERG
ncbi:MAG TPA: SAM-dependent chlorinase/fluorinase, partial [Candidatus Binatia bacterium]|nr:SAM-dependent chlorinase/fluorinase [Candidatus Binatia bacterium]